MYQQRETRHRCSGTVQGHCPSVPLFSDVSPALQRPYLDLADPQRKAQQEAAQAMQNL